MQAVLSNDSKRALALWAKGRRRDGGVGPGEPAVVASACNAGRVDSIFLTVAIGIGRSSRSWVPCGGALPLGAKSVTGGWWSAAVWRE